MVNSGDSFTFNSPASGVFGRQNEVTNSTFTTTNVPPELMSSLVSQAAELSRQLPAEQQATIAAAVEDVQDSEDAPRRRRGVERLAAIAEAAGEIGAPLLRVTGEVVRMISGS
jgi:hypothetical protein